MRRRVRAQLIQIRTRTPRSVAKAAAKISARDCTQEKEVNVQCTGVPQAAADAYKYVRRGGGYCEMGFFVNAGDCTMNPHFDLCNKEITLVGSWVYGANEYIHTLGFLTKAKEMGIPVEKLVTHHYRLDQYVEAMEKNISLTGVKIAICPQQ